MIHEIFPHHFSNQYKANAVVGDEDYILCYKGDKLLLRSTGDEYAFPRRKDFSEIPDLRKTTFLFTLNNVSCFLGWDTPVIDKPGFDYKEISFFRLAKQQEIAWGSIAGYHLMNWYMQNKFCGRCGAETSHSPKERALVCAGCQNVSYPKIAPAIIVALVCNDKILLARNANFPGNWYSLIAGYVDVGESLEETVKREVKEEVGLDVKNIRYYKSQPWPLSGSRMVGFVADADESQPIVADEEEIAEAVWFTRGNLPPHPSDISIAGEIIDRFDKGEL